jgi:hypothetical protein
VNGGIKPGVYRHYKGPQYIVMGVARHANTGELGVVYHGTEPHEEPCPDCTTPSPTNRADATVCTTCRGLHVLLAVPSWNWRPLHGEGGWYTPVGDAYPAKGPAPRPIMRFTLLYPVVSSEHSVP